MKIRNEYQKQGVKSFYQNIENYENPHEKKIHNILNKFLYSINFNKNIKILDLACGNGQVSKFLLKQGFSNIVGCDPYLYEDFKKKTNLDCFTYSFEDIAKGKLSQSFDLVICSFALHLAETSLLPNILWNLKTKDLVIITPHKKPEIKTFFSLEKELYREKVRLRYYKKDF